MSGRRYCKKVHPDYQKVDWKKTKMAQGIRHCVFRRKDETDHDQLNTIASSSKNMADKITQPFTGPPSGVYEQGISNGMEINNTVHNGPTTDIDGLSEWVDMDTDMDPHSKNKPKVNLNHIH